MLLLAAIYSYLALRQYQSYRNCIHADAASIAKVNMDRLYQALALDYLGNSSYYRAKKGADVEKGFSIPANIFIYTVRSKSNQTFFCSVPITDTAAVSLFIEKRFGVNEFRKAGSYRVGTAAGGKLTLAFNDHTFAAAYSLKRENVMDVLDDLLTGKKWLSAEDPRMKQLKALNTQLAYVAEGHTGTGEFKDGLLHMEGDFELKGLEVEGTLFSHRRFDPKAALKMWLNARFKPKHKLASIQVKEHTIYPDSLLKYYRGYLDVELNEPVLQPDTLITYVYNDDFEKEETITPRSVKVPGINAVSSADAKGLFDFLNREHMMFDGRVNKQLFPLYTFYAKRTDAAIMLSTDEKAFFPELRESSPYFFYLEADFGKIKTQRQFPLLESYIKGLNKLNVKAQKVKPGRQHFEMDLYFELKHINAFGQLF